MPEIYFDRYYRYDDLTTLIKAFAEEFPELVSVESIGKSYEGRDIWVATVTNTATGPAEDKPALWVEGNIHATEVSPSSACLYLINKVTSEYGKVDDVTRALDTRVFYICPRLNPDGAEWALADKPKLIRSSTRPYPFDEEPLPGFEQEDIDGDGRMLQMRIKDANGAWKAHPDEPRLMVRRDPAEVGGEYYRIIPEGTIEDYDGVTIQPKRIKEGLDMNRNYPANWRNESKQRGAGPYPTSEPEVRTEVEFVVNHPNITGGVFFHTWSGAILRPYGTRPDSEMPPEDLWVYKEIGNKGTELSGYPNVSVYHDFLYHPKEYITGVQDDWLYHERGAYGWTVEIWSPQQQAGIKDYKFIEWFREHPIEDDMKMLKWSDEVLDGKAYVDWYEFEHPQLGTVELGGWDMFYSWRNPPPQFLEKEIAPFSDWVIWQLLLSPKLEWVKTEVTALGGDNYKVQAVVQNTGWLPSYVSKQALANQVVRGVIFELDLPEGAKIVSGKSREEAGQLEGRNLTPSALNVWHMNAATDDRTKAEWVIQAPAGSKLNVVARHDRAGKLSAELTLE